MKLAAREKVDEAEAAMENAREKCMIASAEGAMEESITSISVCGTLDNIVVMTDKILEAIALVRKQMEE